MTTAVIGWGSLLWDPRTLQHTEPWHPDGPELPIEFARRAGDGRVTLVVTPGYPVPVPTFWAPSTASDVEGAAADLARRERTEPGNIHLCDDRGGRAGDGRPLEDRPALMVADWVRRERGVTAAVWTGLPVTWFRVDATLTDQVVSYVAGLRGPIRERAREYVERAPATVDTPVRRALEDRFGWVRRPLPPGVVGPAG